MKQAILVVSFGTSHPDTLERTIARTEQAVQAAFPEAAVFRAFTSGIIRRKLEREQGIVIRSVEEAMEHIVEQGFEAVTVQPTLVIPGTEFDLLREALAPYRGKIVLRLGKPLLWEQADLERMARLLGEHFAPDGESVLLMMGHGTGHPANDFYVRLAQTFRACEQYCLRLCTVEGTPTFEDALEELRGQPRRRVIAAPLMLVAGDHAKNDMAGDGPESLRSLLEQAGFTVDCRIAGLGEIQEIREIYCRRIREAGEQPGELLDLLEISSYNEK